MNIPGRRIDKGEVVITEPFGRGGDGLFLRAQLISKESGASGNITIQVQTRNSEDSWPGSTLSTLTMPLTGTAGDVTEMHFAPNINGIKEELRLKVTGTSGSGWGLIRVFDPLFYDTAST